MPSQVGRGREQRGEGALQQMWRGNGGFRRPGLCSATVPCPSARCAGKKPSCLCVLLLHSTAEDLGRIQGGSGTVVLPASLGTGVLL